MSGPLLPILFLLLVSTLPTRASSLREIYAKENSPEVSDLYGDSDEAEGASKKAPWGSYHWGEEDRDKRYDNENNRDPLERDAGWASIEFDKKAPWASYDFKRGMSKRDPWAYPRLSSLWSYINRRGRDHFLKSSNKRTRLNELSNSEDIEPSSEVFDYHMLENNKRSMLPMSAHREAVVEHLLDRVSRQPSKREARSLEQTILDIASKRKLGRVRKPSEVHPVNMGLGQHAAGFALDTYSRLLADEQRRLQEGAAEGRPGGSPVRFIGK